jgi:hypothetical protein
MIRTFLRRTSLALIIFSVLPAVSVFAQDSAFVSTLHQLPKITILSDITLIDSPLGDSDVINVIANKRLGKFSIYYIANKLSERGDSIGHINLTSVGLLTSDKLYHVISTPEEFQVPVQYLEFQRPPFYVDPAFRTDTLALPLLKLVFTALLAGEQRETAMGSVIPAAGALGQSLGGSTLLVFFLRGYSIGVAGEYGSDPVASSKITSVIGVRKASHYSLSAFFVRGDTGLVLWSDKVEKSGGDLTEEALTSMLDDLLDKIPSE